MWWLQFFPAWCYALPMTLLDIPLALWEAVLWTAIPYFAVGYYKDAGRSASSVSASKCHSAVLPVASKLFTTFHPCCSVQTSVITYLCETGMCMVTAQHISFQNVMLMHVGCHDLSVCSYLYVCMYASPPWQSQLTWCFVLCKSAFKC